MARTRMKDLANRDAARPVVLRGLDTWDLATLYALAAELLREGVLESLTDEGKDVPDYRELLEKLGSSRFEIEFPRSDS